MDTVMILRMVFTFIVAFIFALAATPLVIRISPKIGAIDVPKDGRRMHKKPIPRIGGLAIFFGCMVSVLCFAEVNRGLIATMLGATVLVVLGIFDDSRGLSAKFKLLIQILAALIVVVFGNIRIDIFTNPNIFSETPVLTLHYWVSIPVTILWIVLMTNAVNFIDGLDGLAVGVSSICAVSIVFICLKLGKPELAVIAIAIAGACLGFLPFNFNPAKTFMGDTGSMFLGFMLAVLSIQGAFKSYAVISFAVPILIVGLPLFDMGFAILRRFFTGKNIMVADRGHVHHRLIDMGFSQKQSVFILYAVTGVLGITAVTLAESGALRALLLFLCMIIVLFAAGFITSKVSGSHSAEKPPTRAQIASAEQPEESIIYLEHIDESTEDTPHEEN